MSITGARKQSGHNLKDVKFINRALIFRAIRDAKKISRAQLAEMTGLNPATITHITRDLLHQGLIEEAGQGESRGGRRSSLLKIYSEGGYIIAVRISRHNIQGILTDLDLQKMVRKTITSSSLSYPIDITIYALLELIHDLIEQSGVDRRKILGIGICAPGPLDARRGVLIAPPNFPGWPSTPIREIVENKTGFPVFLDNDANAAALAEKWFGGGRDWENFVFILGEDGIGGGLVLNGDLFRGGHDIAGEIGHMSIDYNGPKCDCGNYGCLELYAAPKVAEDYVCHAINSGIYTTVLDIAGNNVDLVSFETIVNALQGGDKVAKEAIDIITNALIVGITNLINAFDPEVIVIGGKIVLATDYIIQKVQDNVTSRLMARGDQEVRIIASELKDDAPLIGAFSLVLRELFQNPQAQYLLKQSFGKDMFGDKKGGVFASSYRK
jgi:predicted NBD/HSP70 family sugar kinase